MLKSEDMGSLDIGTPVFFRRLQVGQISSYTMDPDGNGVTLRVFINAPYDKYVHDNTRFWHASGVDVSLDTGGVKVNTQSMVAILIGRVAFQSPDDGESGPQAEGQRPIRLVPGSRGGDEAP
ncbi:MlaD family protein [Cupriavidus basilensis]